MILQYLIDFKKLFYPEVCLACNNPLFSDEEVICLRCERKLPKTNFHLDPINPVIKHFWGKVPVKAATAFYHFAKGGKVQHLIHQLKYKHHPEVGVKVGKIMGVELSKSSWFTDLDLVLPVPLHRNKERMRGYNQSAMFASGLALALGITASTTLLVRSKFTDTQTRKHRFERFENVNSVFEISDRELLKNKNVLLVDDVITTGSTLCACAEAILEIPGTSVSIAAIAQTSH